MSLANEMVWWILFSFPRANWELVIVWLIILVNLLFSSPVSNSKSKLIRLILCLSFSFFELPLPGLCANTILQVLRDRGGFSCSKMICSTLTKVSPII